MTPRSFRLIGADGSSYTSTTKGALGGHRKTKIYGRLDCRAALRAIERGGPYVRFRVFFADEPTAVLAGYRPCAVCMRTEYHAWKTRVSR
jgi:methylphosphotriester-DNA--protein-cysteine methyltransferase